MTIRAAMVALLVVLPVLVTAPSPAEAGQRWKHPLPGARIGPFYTAYGHLNAIKVRKGQRVRAGQGLGWQGQPSDATRKRGVRLGWCR